MNTTRRTLTQAIKLRTFRILLAIISLFGLAALMPMEANAVVTFTVFTDPHPVVSGGTIGFAYAGNKFVGSVQGDGFNVLYSTDLNGGNVQVFAPTVSIAGGNPASEHFLSSSLGLGGFPSRDIYVAEGNGIRHISNDGTSADVFVSGLASAVRGILFDAVGTFGNEMLVTTTGGHIYRINSAGVPTLLTTIGLDTEGLDIAPLGAGFGGFDGQLIVASEGSGQLRAISPAGTVTVLPVFIPNGPEELTFVPLNLGASGNPVEGFYGANYTPNVIKGAASEFAGMQGDVIVTSEVGDHRVTRVHWDGSSFVTSVIGNFPDQPEDGIFVTAAIINPVGNITLSPATATNEVGTVHTVCATVREITPNGQTNPIVGATVTFNVTNGPNATVHGTSVTDSNGVACFTYVGTGGVGTDIIDASFIDESGKRQSTFATKVWVPPSCQVHCPANIIVCNDPGKCSAVVHYPPPGPNDCPLTCNPTNGSVFPVGTTPVVCASGQSGSCSFTVTVHDCEPPKINCPSDMTVCNDPGQCSAVVNYQVSASDNCPGVTVVCAPPSGSVFPKGSTPVTCAAIDSSGNANSCTFHVTVNDCEPPIVACRPGPNPSGKKIPTAGKNPSSGQNPDGFYQLLAKDNCDASPAIYVADSCSSFIAGPFASGDVVKLTQSPGKAFADIPGPQGIAAHIHTKCDPRIVAVDASGNVSVGQSCLVPPPPK